MFSVSLLDYLKYLRNSDILAMKGIGDYIWVKHETFSAIRFPEFITTPVTDIELKNVLKELNCLMVSHCTAPVEMELTNTISYNYFDKNYDHTKLSKNVIRDIGIGKKKLTTNFVTWEEILKQGFQAFRETRQRVGLSDGTKNNFNKRFTRFAQNPGHLAVASKFNDQIIAFMSLIVVESFVIIQGSFSTDEHKKYCPNNTLADFILNYFLNEKDFKLVSYGLSSLQEKTGNAGLHNYKLRVGFDPIKVNRNFTIHPILSPFKSQILFTLTILLKFLPQNRKLKKAHGVFKSMQKLK